MVDKFSREYPVASILVPSAILALVCSLLTAAVADDRPLPTVSVITLLFAGSINSFLVIHSLYAERSIRTDPPMWRIRLALVAAMFWFITSSIMNGVALPSHSALIQLGAGLVFGAFMAPSSWHDKMVHDHKLFDLEQPLWTTQAGSTFVTCSGFAVLIVAGLACLFAPDTASGLFAVIIAIPLMMPLRPTNRICWRERDWLAFSAIAALVIGVFSAT